MFVPFAGNAIASVWDTILIVSALIFVLSWLAFSSERLIGTERSCDFKSRPELSFSWILEVGIMHPHPLHGSNTYMAENHIALVSRIALKLDLSAPQFALALRQVQLLVPTLATPMSAHKPNQSKAERFFIGGDGTDTNGLGIGTKDIDSMDTRSKLNAGNDTNGLSIGKKDYDIFDTFSKLSTGVDTNGSALA